MRLGYAEQYQAVCVIVESSDLPIALTEIDDTIEWAAEQGATFDEEGDECYVIRFPGRPPELFTEAALRGSLGSACRELIQ